MGYFLLQSTMMNLSMPRGDFEQVSPVTYNTQTTINLSSAILYSFAMYWHKEISNIQF